MMLFEVSKPNTFKDYLGCLNTLTEEVNLELDYEGIRAVALDPSHVAMVEFELPNSYFDLYGVGEPEKIGVNLPNVLSALGKITKADHTLKAEYDYKVRNNAEGPTPFRDDERLTLTLMSDIHRKKVLPCLEPLEEEVPKPRILFKSKVRMVAQTLKRILDDLDGEHVTITTKDDTVIFSHKGDRYDESTPLDKDNDNILDLRVEEPTKATYTKDYLSQILKAVVKVSEVVTLEYSEDTPIKIDAEIPQGKLIYHVAPCIGV